MARAEHRNEVGHVGTLALVDHHHLEDRRIVLVEQCFQNLLQMSGIALRIHNHRCRFIFGIGLVGTLAVGTPAVCRHCAHTKKIDGCGQQHAHGGGNQQPKYLKGKFGRKIHLSLLSLRLLMIQVCKISENIKTTYNFANFAS